MAVFRKTVIFCAALLCFALPARAQPALTNARAFVQKFYDWYLPLVQACSPACASARTPENLKKWSFDDGLAALLIEDDAVQQSSPGVITGLDSDPFLNSQDAEGARYRVERVTHRDGTTLVRVRGHNPGGKASNDVLIDVVLRQGGDHWVITNFIFGGRGSSWNLMTTLKSEHDVFNKSEIICQVICVVPAGLRAPSDGGAESAKVFAKGFYDWYFALDKKLEQNNPASVLKHNSTLFDPPLAAALKTVGWSGMGAGDPFLNCASCDNLTMYQAEKSIVDRDKANVRMHSAPNVYSKTGWVVDIELKRNNGHWTIANFRYPDHALPNDLLNFLAKTDPVRYPAPTMVP
jgi:hypothetical protein